MTSIDSSLEFLGPVGVFGLVLVALSLLTGAIVVAIVGATAIHSRRTPVRVLRLHYLAAAGFLFGLALMMIVLDLPAARLAAAIPFGLALVDLRLAARIRVGTRP